MKYIIEIEEKPLCVFDKDTQTYFPRLWRVKGFNSLVLDEEGLSRLEELNSDYINEHCQTMLQDEYDRGYKDGRNVTETQAHDDAYHLGLDDAWEAAKKIFGYEIDGGIPIDEVRRVFGYSEDATFCTADIIRHNTASEAIAKLKAYEDDKIKRGDIVNVKGSCHDELLGVVTKVWEDNCYILWGDGSGGAWCKDSVVKTGKHIDVDKFLGGLSNDD